MRFNNDIGSVLEDLEGSPFTRREIWLNKPCGFKLLDIMEDVLDIKIKSFRFTLGWVYRDSRFSRVEKKASSSDDVDFVSFLLYLVSEMIFNCSLHLQFWYSTWAKYCEFCPYVKSTQTFPSFNRVLPVQVHSKLWHIIWVSPCLSELLGFCLYGIYPHKASLFKEFSVFSAKRQWEPLLHTMYSSYQQILKVLATMCCFKHTLRCWLHYLYISKYYFILFFLNNVGSIYRSFCFQLW